MKSEVRVERYYSPREPDHSGLVAVVLFITAAIVIGSLIAGVRSCVTEGWHGSDPASQERHDTQETPSDGEDLQRKATAPRQEGQDTHGATGWRRPFAAIPTWVYCVGILVSVVLFFILLMDGADARFAMLLFLAIIICLSIKYYKPPM